MSHHSKKSYSLWLSAGAPLSVQCGDSGLGMHPRPGAARGTSSSPRSPGPLPCIEHQLRSFHHENREKGKYLRMFGENTHTHVNKDLPSYTHQFIIINLTHALSFFFFFKAGFHCREGRVSLLCVRGGSTVPPIKV